MNARDMTDAEYATLKSAVIRADANRRTGSAPLSLEPASTQPAAPALKHASGMTATEYEAAKARLGIRTIQRTR